MNVPVRKTLTNSDCNARCNRVLIPSALFDGPLLGLFGNLSLSDNDKRSGRRIKLLDCDTRDQMMVTVSYWRVHRCYAITGGWYKDIVKRRGLHAGNQIDLRWDEDRKALLFKVVQ